jgi:predicted PurR-regulated permease PerM
MKIILTERQYKNLIYENISKESTNKLKSLMDFFKGVSKDTKEQVGFDLSFLVTWGASIAGFVKPVSDFIAGEYPELSSTDLALITTGAILTYFTSNKEKLGRVLEKIKEKLLIAEFDHFLMKCEDLKNAFFGFIESLAIPFTKVSNMLAYTFIIPIIPQLYELAQGYGDTEISEIVKRIVMFLSVSFSTNIIKRLMYSIVKRFKS